MALTRREFYKFALGSVVGLAVLKQSPSALADPRPLQITLKHGAGDKGETLGASLPLIPCVRSVTLIINSSISELSKQCYVTCQRWRFTVFAARHLKT